MSTDLGPEGLTLAPESDLLFAHQLLHSRAGELRNAEDAFSASFLHYQRLLNEQFAGRTLVITGGEVELSVEDQTDTVTASAEAPLKIQIGDVTVEETTSPSLEIIVRQFRPIATGRTENGKASFWLDAIAFTIAPEEQTTSVPQ